MLATAFIYFIATSFGENVEARNHVSKAAETGQENLEGTTHHETTQNSHVGSNGPLQASSSRNSRGSQSYGNFTIRKNNQYKPRKKYMM